MFRPRIIPVLLLQNQGLVKSIQFKSHKYIGDPMNAVKIFNDLKADELVFLDINATKENRLISLDLVSQIGEESNMPFAVGGGIKTIEDIQKVIGAGAEKVIISTVAANNPNFITEASETFGSSTITVCIDVKKNWLGKTYIWTHAGSKSSKYSPLEFALLMQEKGAGELIIQSIEKDGTMTGYDVELIKSISEQLTIPIVALGGAGKVEDLIDAYSNGNATAMAAGSLFVYQSAKRGVLINYPEKSEINFNN